MELEKENKQIEDTDLYSSCIITFLNIIKFVFIRWSRFRAQHKSFFFFFKLFWKLTLSIIFKILFYILYFYPK